MMATAQRLQKLEVRLTAAQRDLIEEAADVSDLGVERWMLERLLACAARDIEEARTVEAADDAYFEFESIMEEDLEEVHSGLREVTPLHLR